MSDELFWLIVCLFPVAFAESVMYALGIVLSPLTWYLERTTPDSPYNRNKRAREKVERERAEREAKLVHDAQIEAQRKAAQDIIDEREGIAWVIEHMPHIARQRGYIQ